MKKKNLIICISILVAIVILMITFGSNWLYSQQYNENGVSHFLVITIDKNQSKEFVGELDGYKIYIEKLNIKETNFRNVKAENVSIKKAIEEKLVSVAEWKKYAWIIIKDKDAEILQFENYEIVCSNDECTIRPLSR